MRVVIDMQGAQSVGSGARGIGRYISEMTKNLILSAQGEIEVFLALNGKLDCESILEYFEGILDREHIKVWEYEPEVGPASSFDHEDAQSIDYFREWFFHQFHADVIWNPVLHEGYHENNISNSAKLTPGRETIVSTLHDVIPLMFKEDYLQGDPADWYAKRIKYCTDSDILITDSKHAKKTISELTGISSDKIYVTTLGFDREQFYPDEDCCDAEHKEHFFLYVGGTDMRKNLSTLFEAYARLENETRDEYHLLLVGQEPLTFRNTLLEQANQYGIEDGQIETPGFVSDDDLRSLLQKCTGFVFPSLAEGFGLPPLEAMACGSPVLVADATSLKEIVNNSDAVFDPYDAEALFLKMQALIQDHSFSNKLIRWGLNRAKDYSWEKAGEELKNLFLRCPPAKEGAIYSEADLCADLLPLLPPADYRMKAAIARSIEKNRLFLPVRRIFVDASSSVTLEFVTGIQRVTNGVISSLKKIYANDSSVEICAVYSDSTTGDFYRAVYNGKKYIRKKHPKSSDIVSFHDRDTLLITDLDIENCRAKKDYLKKLSTHGVKVVTLLHDLIAVDYPKYCDPELVKIFEDYLVAISQFSGVIGVSKATLDRYFLWCKENEIEFPPYFLTGFNHNGCDIAKANPSRGLPEDAPEILEMISSKPTVLMVGTIEPRKKHEQVLSAMETLWDDGKDVNLVFVGRYGWNMEEFRETIEDHPEKGKHFFWLKGISDEYLDKVYDAGTGVIMASVAEGYGLPIIEAAQYGKPLLLRDIPVFREIAGENALYFQKDDAESLGQSIAEWLERIKLGTAGNPAAIKSYTWEESTRNLITMIDEFFSSVHEKDDSDSK